MFFSSMPPGPGDAAASISNGIHQSVLHYFPVGGASAPMGRGDLAAKWTSYPVTRHFNSPFPRSLRQNLLVIPPWMSNLLIIMFAATSGRNERSLLTTYRQGLEPNLWLHLVAHDDGIGLEKFIQLSIRVAHRVQGCMEHRQDQQSSHQSLQPESASNLISGELCRYLKLKKRCNETHYKVQSITGILLSRERVRYSFGPLHLQIGLLHTEFIYFLVLEKSNADIIIGCTWLIKYHPVLSWSTGEVMKWGDRFFPDYFPELPLLTLPPIRNLPLHSTSIESPIQQQSFDIPAYYTPFRDVFCPKLASQLPPHRPGP
ncbi:hypothetical protein DPX16_16499 [Anabarilius grahami]|uniref:Uncharacterized protein n=1 Tax=Anabarilius grahami TaxID=495550 RepID=A0A3N0XXR4_ANAGA|nr:hypothetical protein DPX16_16499 [Anabarilius grahami]